ncbi:uncharacterized protein LOC132733258 [Ruditapes philippinarum]|uniref:uncharacterized protein LOC132733258 n=1 Tax=Ruditapes philippinarum TaxID=129788 RepID=UPI00295C1415|nr:uncharacterized protein LOC132733258 [Ruditapes philippinarum]
MFKTPEYSKRLSMKLSQVFEDIGVNEKMVIKRRRAFMLIESIETVSNGNDCTTYYFGSQSEGTTTLELGSDVDTMIVYHTDNVIQELPEWRHNKNNFLMIQDENVTPGYCFLQLLRYDFPFPVTTIPNDEFFRDKNRRILLKNTIRSGIIRDNSERHGPSEALAGREGYIDTDLVRALPCFSWPKSASHFLEQGTRKWPFNEMIRYATSNGCFVVGASSKIAVHSNLEWRISTSLAERCFMFNLNLTQLQCYVLLKIILKTFLNTNKTNELSSYMCTT